jgi:hypothetical protein
MKRIGWQQLLIAHLAAIFGMPRHALEGQEEKQFGIALTKTQRTKTQKTKTMARNTNTNTHTHKNTTQKNTKRTQHKSY